MSHFPSSILQISSRSQIFALFFFHSPALSLDSHKLNGRLNQISMIWLWRTLTAWNTLKCYWHKYTHLQPSQRPFSFQLVVLNLMPQRLFATIFFHLCLLFNVVQGACQHAVFLLGWQRILCIHALFLKLLFT